MGTPLFGSLLMMCLAAVCSSFGGAVEAPQYEVATRVQAGHAPSGAFRSLAQQARTGSAQLLSVGEDSAVYFVDVTGGSVVLHAGEPGKAKHSDGDRLQGASFHRPSAVCVLPSGHALVTDTGSATVRHIHATTGMVSTVAGQPYSMGYKDGTGQQARFGTPIGLPNQEAALVGDPSTQSLRLLQCQTPSATGTAPTCTVSTLLRLTTTATHGLFLHLAVDPHNPHRLLISDGHSAVWELPDITAPEAGASLFAGVANETGSADGPRSGGARFNMPHAVCVTAQGHVVVADTASSTVRHIDAATGEVYTVAGIAGKPGGTDGAGRGALLTAPTSLVCTPDGLVLLGEQGKVQATRLRELKCVSGCTQAPSSGDDDKGGESGSHAGRPQKLLLAGVAGAGLLVGALAVAAWGQCSDLLHAHVMGRMSAMRAKHTRSYPANGSQDLEHQAPLLLGDAAEDPEPETDLLQLHDTELLGQEVQPVRPHTAAPQHASQLSTGAGAGAAGGLGNDPQTEPHMGAAGGEQACAGGEQARAGDHQDLV